MERRDAVGAGSGAAAAVKVLDRVAEAGAEASLEEARIVVVGGRGVGSPEGFAVVDRAGRALLGGVVGATRASVDAGWIPYARQIGQTGKIVKPSLYLGLGVSGAMQHRVGMQSADAIVIVNRDPDAPIAEIADLFVIGDLFEVGPALVGRAALPARRLTRRPGEQASDGLKDRRDAADGDHLAGPAAAGPGRPARDHRRAGCRR